MISSAVIDPAFMGSDSKVSSGLAPEDVVETGDDAIVHRVLEQEEWGLLVIELMSELERVTEKADVGFKAGSWVLMRGATCEIDAGGAILLVGGSTCELAGDEFREDGSSGVTVVDIDGSGGSGAEALVFGESAGLSVFGGGASDLGFSAGFSVFGGSTSLVVFFPPLFAAAST